MREELIKFKRCQKQFHFLIENNIEIIEQLINFKENTEKKISELAFVINQAMSFLMSQAVYL